MLEHNKDINVLSTVELAGIAAGKKIERCIEKLQDVKETIRIVFAAAPSQDSMLDYLTKSKKIKWGNIIAFNMDEYIGLPSGAPQSFASYLENNLFSKVVVKKKYTINPNSNIEDELVRYSHLIKSGPIDIVCLGIGENGHIAFNDPPVADFNDPQVIKIVELDAMCRGQQVNDNCFDKLEDVPMKAITLTIPTLMAGKKIFCIVTGKNKADAVCKTLTGPIDESCPATILRIHDECSFYFDEAAFENTKKKRLQL